MNNYTIEDIKILINKTLEEKTIDNEYLMEKWQQQSAVSNGSHHLYYHLFYRISKELQPKTVVELGGWRGLAAGCFAAGRADCKVVTIDHHSDPGDEDHRKAMLEICGKFYNINYLKGWTWDVFPEAKKIAPAIDILFVDGWHHYEYAMKDWELYSPLLSDKALVICDDLVRGDSATIAGMERFWKEISGDFEKHIEDSEIHAGFPMGFFIYER